MPYRNTACCAAAPAAKPNQVTPIRAFLSVRPFAFAFFREISRIFFTASR
jgi:hypothetical protein